MMLLNKFSSQLIISLLLVTCVIDRGRFIYYLVLEKLPMNRECTLDLYIIFI